MITPIVSLQEAKDHLKPPGDIDDERIERLMRAASMVVLDHIKQDYDAYNDTSGNLDETLVPDSVREATLLVLGALYDNADGQDPDKIPISEAVCVLLRPRRTPTLA